MRSTSVRAELQRQRDAEQNELVRVRLNAALAVSATDLAQLLESEAWIHPGGLDELLPCVYKAQDDGARRLAAGLVAGLGAGDPETVQLKLLSALAFHPSANDVPWQGGALYVPSVNWGTLEARFLVRELLSWMVWCDRRPGFDAEVQVLQNNLRSVGLIRIAGFQAPGSASVADWVSAYGHCFGAIELERLMAGLGPERR